VRQRFKCVTSYFVELLLFFREALGEEPETAGGEDEKSDDDGEGKFEEGEGGESEEPEEPEDDQPAGCFCCVWKRDVVAMIETDESKREESGAGEWEGEIDADADETREERLERDESR
jgi:hypothetical protein